MKFSKETVLITALLSGIANCAPTSSSLGSDTNATTDAESYLIFGTKDLYSTSPPFYPSPEGGRIDNDWQDAYAKARSVVDTLNIAEKVNITTGVGTGFSRCSGNTGFVHGDGFEFLEGFCGNDGPLGVRGTDFVTAFPAALTVASSFNKSLIYDRGDAIGSEFKAKGVDYMLGPVCGPIGAKALAGRGWESFGPDPYLQGEAIKYTVQGIQKNKVIAVSKHFIGNEQEHYRLNEEELPDGTETIVAISENIDDRSMHEIYLWPFAEAVRAGTASIMCSYNKVNGSDGCGNSYTLNNLLKTELGFQGFVMSDWYATKSGVASVLSGLDMNMPGDNLIGEGSYYGGNLTQAVVNGTVPEERLNDMATRILASYFFVGTNHTGPNYSSVTDDTYEHEYFNSGTDKGYGQVIMVNEHVDARDAFSDEVAYQSAIEGIALLKNENNALPLSNDLRKIAVLGQVSGISEDGFSCNNLLSCIGGAPPTGYGSGAGSPSKFISPAEAISQRCREQNIQYDIVRESWNFEYSMNKAMSAEAVIVFAASIAGEAVAMVDGNYGDRNNASLWFNADALIKNVTAYNNNTIVVITTPGSVNLESFVDNENVTSILMSSFLGQEAGNAITDVLFGDYNPSGRIPFTIARNDSDYLPIIYNTTSYEPQDYLTRSIFLDYRYFDFYNITPRYEFGHGLSYSNFTFSGLNITNIKSLSTNLQPAAAYLSTYNFTSDDMNPEDYTFPADIDRLEGFIYPYIESADISTQDSYPFPEGYSTTQLETPPLPAGGSGGNPELWDVAYHVEASLTNNGPYNGAYVGQLYIGFPYSSQFPNSPRQLRGFDKIALELGETGIIQFDITRKDLSVWDVITQTWIVQRGTYTIYVGSSSRNLELVDNITIF